MYIVWCGLHFPSLLTAAKAKMEANFESGINNLTSSDNKVQPMGENWAQHTAFFTGSNGIRSK